MRERPKGAVARATAVAEGVAGAVRRRQREREPRVVLYGAPGAPRLLPPGAKGQDDLLDVADQLVLLAKSANSGDS
ncbi:MAG TPA: hypothetical protein VEW67_00670 [Thermoleophilaceae bacterium]|nr:hypothetical protein [Thermoleophilaceae bacterium]